MKLEVSKEDLYRILKEIIENEYVQRCRSYCNLVLRSKIENKYANPVGKSVLQEKGEGYETKSMSMDVYLEEIHGENGGIVERMMNRFLEGLCNAAEAIADVNLDVDPIQKTRRKRYTCTIFVKKTPESKNFVVSGDPLNCISYGECMIDGREGLAGYKNRFEFCKIRKIVENYFKNEE